MDTSVEIIWSGGALLGEGPCWDAANGVLSWVDIKGRQLFQKPSNGRVSVYSAPELLSSVALSNVGLVGALGSTICHLSLEGDAVKSAGVLARLQNPPSYLRFNDGKVAPDGAYWVGVMDDEETRQIGAWWRLAPSGEMTEVDTGYDVTNGPAFDHDLGRTYLTDSGARTIYVTEGWDAVSCRRKRVFRKFSETEGYPDGMTVDASGHLWVAFWDGACVRALSPMTGETVLEIHLPAARPTSCEFGGPDHSTLFVTSARIDLAQPSDSDGALFAIHATGIKGRQGTQFISTTTSQ